jgi:hypothetical protein
MVLAMGSGKAADAKELISGNCWPTYMIPVCLLDIRHRFSWSLAVVWSVGALRALHQQPPPLAPLAPRCTWYGP